jgi:hypothetical protein
VSWNQVDFDCPPSPRLEGKKAARYARSRPRGAATRQRHQPVRPRVAGDGRRICARDGRWDRALQPGLLAFIDRLMPQFFGLSEKELQAVGARQEWSSTEGKNPCGGCAAPAGMHDDCVCALALAVRLHSQPMRRAIWPALAPDPLPARRRGLAA